LHSHPQHNYGWWVGSVAGADPVATLRLAAAAALGIAVVGALCADIILVVDEGTILESGRHEQLLQSGGGLYAQLHDLQFRQEENVTGP